MAISCSSTGLDRSIPERRALARGQRAALSDALQRHLPDWRHDPPAGGLVLWVEMPQPIGTSLMVLAREYGLALTPGPRFATHGLLERYVRLPYTARPADLESAVSLIAEIVPRVATGRDPGTPLSAYAV
jgi:DNA-binding transcriptional MocR family regulator